VRGVRWRARDQRGAASARHRASAVPRRPPRRRRRRGPRGAPGRPRRRPWARPRPWAPPRRGTPPGSPNWTNALTSITNTSTWGLCRFVSSKDFGLFLRTSAVESGHKLLTNVISAPPRKTRPVLKSEF